MSHIPISPHSPLVHLTADEDIDTLDSLTRLRRIVEPRRDDEHHSSSSSLFYLPSHLQDLNSHAIWRVSSAKPGNGIEQLLDRDPITYWQSDGFQPHTITASFRVKIKISSIQLYLDFASDESYTPAVLSVYAGSNPHALNLVRRLRPLHAPQGWVNIPMGDMAEMCDDLGPEEEDDELSEGPQDMDVDTRQREKLVRRERKVRALRKEQEKKWKEYLQNSPNGDLQIMRDLEVRRTFMVRVVIERNHQNGRDCHVRMVRAIGPKRQMETNYKSRYGSTEFRMHEQIR